MSARQRNDEWIRVHHVDVQPVIGSGWRAQNDREIDPSVSQRIGLLWGVHLVQGEADAWKMHSKKREHVRENARVSGGVDEAHAKPARFAFGRALGRTLGALRLRKR